MDENTDEALGSSSQPGRTPTSESDRLVGTWEVSGGARGKVTFEWMEGGFFLIQRVDLEQHGQRIKGIEIIGPRAALRCRAERGHKERASTTTRATPSTTSTSSRGTPSRSGPERRVLPRTTRAPSAATPCPVSGCTRVAAGMPRPRPGSGRGGPDGRRWQPGRRTRSHQQRHACRWRQPLRSWSCLSLCTPSNRGWIPRGAWSASTRSGATAG